MVIKNITEGTVEITFDDSVADFRCKLDNGQFEDCEFHT